MSTLRVITARGVTPERLAGWGERLLAQELGAATLVVAELDVVGGATVLLGRHQRAASAIDAARVSERGWRIGRRLGGGKSIVVTSGTIGVLFVVPPGAGLTLTFAAEKAINRYVRGLLRGIGGAGVAGAAAGAFYFGRDFVSADKRQLAIVSQDGAPGGTLLFEAYVAREAPLALPPELSRYPQHGDGRAAGPAHTTLAELGRGRDFGALAAAIAAGYAQTTGAATVDEGAAEAFADVEDAAIGPPVAEDDDGWAWSGVADVPIGFLEAQVRLGEGGRVQGARLRGDFIAPAFVIRHLEAALVGVRPELGPVAARVDAAFALPGATVVGVTHLRIVADAVVACATA